MKTAGGYRFPLGEYFLLFLASLLLICSLTLEPTFIFQGGPCCCTSLVWRVMSLLQHDFSFKSLLCKAAIISSGHKEKAGEKEAGICGILWCWFHCVKLHPMPMSQLRVQDENYFPLVFTVHVQKRGMADSCTLQIVHLENFCYFPSITSEILIIHCKKIKKIMEWGGLFWKGKQQTLPVSSPKECSQI